MVTGLDLSKLFDDKIDNSYSDYVSVPKKQRAFDNAFLRIIENKYRGMDTQKEFDELSELMVIDKEMLINNNRFRTTPIPLRAVSTTTFTFSAEHNLVVNDTFTVNGTGTLNDGVTYTVVSVSSATEVVADIAGVAVQANQGYATTTHSTFNNQPADSMLSDYLHVLAIKCYMYDYDDSVPVYKAYAGTPGILEFFRPIKARNKDYIHGSTFSGDLGFVVLKQISEFKYEVYQASFPPSFSTPFTLTQATADNIDSIEQVEENWAKYLQSDRRISKSGEPSIDEPRFNQDRNFILIHPRGAVCPAVSVDYIRKPDVEVIVNDDVQDLTLFYSETLLNRLTDEAVKMFYQEVRDPNQYQVADREMLDNP
jgi:hypothetical protein